MAVTAPFMLFLSKIISLPLTTSKTGTFLRRLLYQPHPSHFFFQLGVFVAVTGNKLFIKIGAIYAFPEQNHSQSQDQWQLIRF